MMARCLSALALLAVVPGVPADIPWPEVRERCAEENARLASRPQGHDGTYFVVCTIYYTPIESGFTAERGFDVTPQEAPGLGGAIFARDFLRAVKLEGYGKMTTPVSGKHYLAYHAGQYKYADKPRGRGIVPLEPRKSAAVRLGRGDLPDNAEVVTTAAEIEEVFGANRWKIIDTGGGLRRWQLDLYWGEDEPLTPDRIGRPRGTEFEYGYSLVRIVASERKEEEKKTEEAEDAGSTR